MAEAVETGIGRESGGGLAAVTGDNDGAGLGAELKTSQISSSFIGEDAGDGLAGGATGVKFGTGVAVADVLFDETRGPGGGGRKGGVELGTLGRDAGSRRLPPSPNGSTEDGT